MIKSEEASVPQVFVSNEIHEERKRTMAMTQVFERLYIGDVSDADTLAVSNPFGFTAVVNVSTEPNQEKREGITYVHHPLDESEWILPRRFDLIMTATCKLVRGGTVLVHCGAGISRSPVVVALYMHIVGFKNFDDALSELRNLRPVVAPSKLILERAKAYLEGLT
jgi:dual specificity protein phosphatase-like protein